MLNWKWVLAAGATAAALGIAGPVAAQDVNLPPSYGEISFGAGLESDPFEVELRAGGAIDASVSIESTCLGSIAHAPDFNLTYDAGDMPLYVSASSQSDTTLIVNSPDGEWHCNDDFEGNFDPVLAFEEPQSGLYNIWVGTYGATTTLPEATLRISEVEAPIVPPAKLASGVDWDLDPNFGSVSLSAGFEEDPYVIDVVAGGEVNAAFVDAACWGSISRAPDYRLDYSDADEYNLTFTAVSAGDTTLLVRDPEGGFHCDDDSFGNFNPRVDVNAPQDGAYYVWIGIYGQGNGYADAQLGISEIGAGPAGSTGNIDWTLEPNFGSVDLVTGFVPDPHTVELIAGGEEDASQLGFTCRGFVAAAPDFRLSFEAGNLPLTFSAISDSDTTLAVRDPSGVIHCDDDSGGGLNPQLTVDGPASGDYHVWVGVYGQSGGYPSATLSISEIGASSNPGAVELEVDGEPSYGDASLESGFSPDPYVVSLNAGGNVEAYTLGFSCNGYIAARPDFAIDFSGESEALYISASSSVDTTLVVSAPDGSWLCNDDFFGLNPAIELESPREGTYRIWVGTWNDTDELPPATLYISEDEAQF